MYINEHLQSVIFQAIYIIVNNSIFLVKPTLFEKHILI